MQLKSISFSLNLINSNTIKYENFKISICINLTFTVSAQQVANFTYLDVPTQEIGKFEYVKTLKTENGQNHGLLTHFYGSNVVIWLLSVEDVYSDNALEAITEKHL